MINESCENPDKSFCASSNRLLAFFSAVTGLFTTYTFFLCSRFSACSTVLSSLIRHLKTIQEFHPCLLDKRSSKCGTKCCACDMRRQMYPLVDLQEFGTNLAISLRTEERKGLSCGCVVIFTRFFMFPVSTSLDHGRNHRAPKFVQFF